jgi:SNF2 family DNA or RNA helicase
LKYLITKPKIGAFGLNFQSCAHVVFFASHSYEQYYQGVRRCWRFGQKRPVKVDTIYTEGEKLIMKNIKRKARAADKMFTNLIHHMQDALKINRKQYQQIKVELPSWLNK